jgi:hypothetical protein
MLLTMRAYVFTCGLVLMRALLCLAMIVGLSVILAIALMRVACFATEECFLFMHTHRRLRDRLVPIKLILVNGTVWASPHLHWNRGQRSCARRGGGRAFRGSEAE